MCSSDLEEVGLVRPARSANRYRSYSVHDLHKLRFLQRARGLGFSVGDCRTLLSLYEDRQRSSADVKTIAERHLARVDAKIAGLASLRAALAGLIDACHGDHRPDCPILDDLAGAGADGERP